MMPLLKPGDVFPSLTVPRVGGGSLAIPDVFDDGYGVVLFYRAAGARTAMPSSGPSNALSTASTAKVRRWLPCQLTTKQLLPN